MSKYCHVNYPLNADTSISQVSVDPMAIAALAGTANARLTCSIQLTNAIGPDYSALSVSWLNLVSTEDGSLIAMTQKIFKSTLNIPLIMKGQYCCNASLTGNPTIVSACASVEILSIQLFAYHNTLIVRLNYVDIDVSSPYQSLTLGSTEMITCSVTGVPTTAFKWLFQNGSVVNSSNVLTLKPVDYTHNGRVFTCSVNSSQLYSPGQKSITITVKGM